jgi:GT2 family glycosyltransferase
MIRVSVVVPTYNRLPRLKQVLAALERQSYPRDQFEVVIVSDGSTDGTHEYLRMMCTPLRLNVVIQANGGPAAARNGGIAHAQGEYILFIDDDVVPEPALLAEHMRFHGEDTSTIVLGPMLTPDDFPLQPWVAWEQAMLMKQYKAMQHREWQPTSRQFYTGNTSLARRFLVQVGGFDERYRRAEDVELAYRLEHFGVTFVFNPRAVGYHYAERSFRSWNETPYAYGRNDVLFARAGQSWILDAIREEFKQRNRFTRALVRLCLDRPNLSNQVQATLKVLATLCYRVGGERFSHPAYSALFNLRYYQGAADELGGRQQLFLIGQPQPRTPTKPRPPQSTAHRS